jgi:hypothetical protein
MQATQYDLCAARAPLRSQLIRPAGAGDVCLYANQINVPFDLGVFDMLIPNHDIPLVFRRHTGDGQ